MPRKIDMRKVELARFRHDEADEAYEGWESEQYEKLCAHDYDPDEYPVASRPSTTRCEKQFKRSRQVTLGSRMVVDE